MKKNRKRKIINRNIVMLVIVFVAVMAALIHSYAEESNVSQEEIESSDTIHNVNYSYTSDNEKYYQAFEYQDEMLAADSGTLSPDLAKVTVGLATAAYAESEIKACLSSMNYTLVDSKTFNYDGERKATYEDNDFVAFSIGYKKVSLNGETYNAYVVPIRGTTGNDEWLSNFKLGAAGDSYHYGFKKAADGVLSTLRSKIKTKNNIFLITGHSRGAAVANIVAGELTIDKDLASPNHIFGYTYACPAVKIGADTTLDNVININNPGDAIPELPLADWGYQRYGKSLSLSTQKKFYDNMKVQYKNALGREYAGILNTDSYVATLKTIAGTREAYFQPENQMLFELAGWLLGPKTKEMDTLAKILAHYNVNGLIAKSISNILSDITVSGVQTAFDKENQNNKEILITIDGYLEDTVNMNESEFEDWRKSISNTSTFEKLQDEMNITIRTRSDLVQLRKEVKEEMDSFSYTQSNLETILSLFYTTKGELKNAIFDGHTPLTYAKWINSTYYGCYGWQNNDDVKNMEIENNIKRIDISCFQGCQNLNQVTLPDTLEHVRGDAFEDCTGIKELTMPVDLDYVKTYSSTDGYSSFEKCENIEKITYSKGKTGIMPDIESGSASYTAEYYAGKKLTTVEFEEGVKNIGARAYQLCKSSNPASVYDYGMPNLKNIKLAATVKKIGDDAFYEDQAITDFDFSNIEELGESSFSGCSGLSDLTIPAGMKEIPVSCFNGCIGLSSLKIPETIEKVCGSAFTGCTGIKELTMPVDLDYVKTYSSTDGYSSFEKCENIEKITYSKGKTGIMPDIEDAYYTAEYYAGKNLTTVEFEEGVKNIGARAYQLYRKSASSGYAYGMPNLKNIKLASTVKKIGDDAFYEDKAITDFDFSNIEELGESSFSGCSGLSDLTIPAGMKEIPVSCFNGCIGLSSLKIPETIEKVCGSAFTGCTGIKELTMPVDLDYVKTYSSTDGYSSFSNCGNIEKITYTKGKTGIMPDIESGSASYYTAEYYAGKKLTTVEFQSGIEYIGAGSFDQASALKNIVLPCTVSAISSKTFCAINKSKAVIYGTKDTYAESYAKEQKIPFRGWNDPIITPEEPVAAPEEQVQLMGIAYTGVDEYVNISDWSVKECESKDTHIDENGLLTVGKDEPKGEIVVAACYGNYTETVKVRIVNPTYTVHFVGDITLDAKTDENCNVYCPREYEEKGYEYQYYLGKDTDSEQIEEKDWPLTVAQDTEIYVKKILKEPSIDKINPTEKEMDFIYDGEKREISISASHEIGEKGVLCYQWYYDEMQDGDFEKIHLATGASISVKDVKDSGVYKCRVTLCDGKDTTWVDSKMVRVNITQRVVLIPILQDSQKNLYYTGVEQKLLFEKLETDWVNITEAAATLPGNYVASVGLKDAENSIWADGAKEAKEYPWKIIGKETTPKPLESPTVTNTPTYEPGNTARPSGAPDENPSKTPEIKPGEVPTESPAATDAPTYEPGNTARPSGAPDENPERTPEIKASEVPADVLEIKPTIAPDKITTGSQDTDLVSQPEDMTGDSREEALFLEKKVNVKKLQNKKKNKLYISWGKVELPQKAFYQVQISTKRNFKGAKNIYTTKSIYCYKGVKKGKKYYVRVRLGVTRDGKKIYGKWSNLKKKKIKN